MSRKVQTAVKINKDRKGTMQILFPTSCLQHHARARILKDTCCVNISSKLSFWSSTTMGIHHQSSFVVEFLYGFRAYPIHSTKPHYFSPIYSNWPDIVYYTTHTWTWYVVWSLVTSKRRVSIDSIPLRGLLKATLIDWSCLEMHMGCESGNYCARF